MKPVCDIGKKPSDQTAECFPSDPWRFAFQGEGYNSGEGPDVLGLEADLIA